MRCWCFGVRVEARDVNERAGTAAGATGCGNDPPEQHAGSGAPRIVAHEHPVCAVASAGANSKSRAKPGSAAPRSRGFNTRLSCFQALHSKHHVKMRALRVVSRTASSLASRIRGQVAPAPSRAASTLAKQLSYVNGPSTKPLTGKTIGQALDESAARFGERTAIVARQQHVKWTYGELQDQVDRLAASFLRMGLKNGDRLAIWATNCSEWVVIQLATAKAGIISVFLNPAYRPLELAYALNKVECSALVIDRPFKSSNYEAMVREVCPELNDAKLGHLHAKAVPSLRHVVSLAAHHHAGMHRFKDLVGAATPGDVSEMRALADTLDADDAINIQMTSGTSEWQLSCEARHPAVVAGVCAWHSLGGWWSNQFVCWPACSRQAKSHGSVAPQHPEQRDHRGRPAGPHARGRHRWQPAPVSLHGASVCGRRHWPAAWLALCAFTLRAACLASAGQRDVVAERRGARRRAADPQRGF